MNATNEIPRNEAHVNTKEIPMSNAPNTTLDDARVQRDGALTALARAEAEYGEVSTDAAASAVAWRRVAVARERVDQAAVFFREAQRRANELATRAAEKERAVLKRKMTAAKRVAEPEWLCATVATEVSRLVDLHREIQASIVPAIREKLREHHEANRSLAHLANELGEEAPRAHGLGYGLIESQVESLVGRAIAKAMHAEGRVRADNITGWLQPVWL